MNGRQVSSCKIYSERVFVPLVKQWGLSSCCFTCYARWLGRCDINWGTYVGFVISVLDNRLSTLDDHAQEYFQIYSIGRMPLRRCYRFAFDESVRTNYRKKGEKERYHHSTGAGRTFHHLTVQY